MTLIAHLCALCAVSALMQAALPEGERGGIRVIGGLLMLHLVLSGAQRMAASLLAARDLAGIFGALMK